jgi:predicted hotdog family 3-hydroxylacyl-ACP dehydratase
VNSGDLSIAQLVPHQGAMSLLDEVIAADDSVLEAVLVVRDDGLFSTNDGRVPALVAVEYMAQAVAAFAGVRGIARGEGIQPGLLLGARNFTSSVSHFATGDRLGVKVSLVLEGTNGLGVFDCEVTGPNILVTARLTVLRIESLNDIGLSPNTNGSVHTAREREIER